MGIESIPKYLILSRLIWRLVRPVAVAVAKSTKNTTVDDQMVSAVDVIMSARTEDFDNVEKT